MPSITINLTAQQAQRLQDAITESGNMQTPATVEDAQAFIKSFLKASVESSERRVAERQLQTNLFDPEVL